MFVYVFVEVLDSDFWVMGVLIGVWAWIWLWLFWLGVTGCGCGTVGFNLCIVGFFAIGGVFAFCRLHQNLAPIFTTLQRIIPRGSRVEALIKFIVEQVIHYYTFLLIWKNKNYFCQIQIQNLLYWSHVSYQRVYSC